MKKTLLASLVCALVLCVSAVNANYIDYTYKSVDGKVTGAGWSIDDLWGTGTPGFGSSGTETGVWRVIDQPKDINFQIGPSSTPYFTFETLGSATGVLSIATDFIFNYDTPVEGIVKFLFDNKSASVVKLGFSVENANGVYNLDSEIIESNNGYFDVDLSNLIKGKNTLIFTVDYSTGSDASFNSGFGIHDVEPSSSTPEPATLAILGLGTLGAGFAARRRLAKK